MTILSFAAKSLARRPAIAGLLAVAVAVAVALPGAGRAVVSAFEEELTTRAAAAPLVLGAAGSSSDLVLHALYFRTAPPGEIDVAAWNRLAGEQLAETVPLCVRSTARGAPVVGTDAGYFRLRRLTLASGGPIDGLGDCVVGAAAARRIGLRPGDRLATDPENVFTLSGGVPVRLTVAGILAAAGTADDEAVFVSLETAWLIAGLGHAHENPAAAHEGDGAAGPSGGFLEVTDANAGRFHFHGRRDRYPLTAVLAVPRDEKARLLLVGRYLDRDEPVQLAESDHVVADLIGVALRLRRVLDANAALASAATLLLCGAVVTLALRLRRDEIRTMHRLGLPRGRIAALFAAEFGLIGLFAVGGAVGLVGLVSLAAPTLFRWLVA